MVAGWEPLVVFWTRWGIHFMVVASFTVQVTLLLFSDIRRRKDSVLLKGVIWLAYTLAETTAVYALGHMSVLCSWSPEHQLMALWAPLLLVHLGGQDNISAYSMEDNRLWSRHLQTCLLQVAAAGYVLHVSSILSHPSGKLRSAVILMLVVGVLKYGERMWALIRANSCVSSSLSARSYEKVCRTYGNQARARFSEAVRQTISRDHFANLLDCLHQAHSLLFVPKQMFEGPTIYVQISNVEDKVRRVGDMLELVQLQLSMMYDLLYTKAVVVHTWYGLFSRVISVPFTVTALVLFRSSLGSDKDAAVAPDEYYSRADVAITHVLLVGAVVLEAVSVMRAIFSRWTAVLLLQKQWYILASVVSVVECVVMVSTGRLFQSDVCWSGRMGQHNLFELKHHSDYSIGRKVAKRIGMEDWWDSNAYSSSVRVPKHVISTLLELVSSSTFEEITNSWGQNAVGRAMPYDVTLIWTTTMEGLKLEEIILVWHIATHAFIEFNYRGGGTSDEEAVLEAVEALANYMFFLLAARPHMLPYPVSRQAYVQLCNVAVTHFPRHNTRLSLELAISNQREALMEGKPLEPDQGIGPQGNQETGDAQPPSSLSSSSSSSSMNATLDRGCQLAAKLNYVTVDGPVRGCRYYTLRMILGVWVEILCYTAYFCNEKSHAKHLTDGGEFMTFITLFMIYMKNDLILQDTSTSNRTASPTSQGATANDTNDTDINSVV